VILWKDFILDDVVGPILDVDFDDEKEILTSCRRKRIGSPSVMEDANGIIQETRQEQRPARMVGLSNLDSPAEPHMEVSLGDRHVSRLRGEV
jgi:hypothetical protein